MADDLLTSGWIPRPPPMSFRVNSKKSERIGLFLSFDFESEILTLFEEAAKLGKASKDTYI